MIRIRPMVAADAEALYAIFFRAVREGAADAYTDAQRVAWAPDDTMPADWPRRLADQVTVVADAGTYPVGFMTLGRDGHLDLAYVAPEAMGCGVAAALHDRLLVAAGELGLQQLDTDASHLARRFFTRQGWTMVAEQQVERHGQRLTNFRMEKRLARL